MSNKNKAPIKPFVALTPVDDEQIYNNFKDALDFALDEKEIHNIGLTGPYGSGKSSVIKSYESRAKKGKFLNVSLASFTDINQSNNEDSFAEPNKETSKQSKVDTKEIEKGILQQIIFSVPQTKLPFSRLNRIKEPYRPNWIAGLLFGWLLLMAYFYQEKEYFVTFEFLNAKLWFIAFWHTALGYLLAIPVLIFKDIYISFHKISLKEISYGKAKIVSDDFNSQSIFNQFLDEIIYFFSVSEISIVVFEDIDRFNKPEIFVKLREINKIVNDNIQYKNKKNKPIKFIYLLKDSIFNKDENRTKFFDFIIPIIPVTNDFNSFEKIIGKIDHLEIKGIDKIFLDDASYFIYDLRLINNIFNEFNIILKQLGSNALNKTKLLAMVMYKNYYPGDFENLHKREGVLYSIIKSKTEIQKDCVKKINEKIESEKTKIENLQREVATNNQEIVNMYIGHMLRVSGITDGHSILVNGEYVHYSNIQVDHLKRLYNENSRVTIISRSGPHDVGSFSEIEKKLNNKINFLQRADFIGREQEISRVSKELESHQTELKIVEKGKMRDVLSGNLDELNKIINETGLENGDLLRFLLLKGYLDEDYYIYVSIFHENAWTVRDRDFLIQVKSHKEYDPNYKIDNPAEVLQRLRNDYSSNQLLNVDIFDYILNNSSRHAAAFAGIERYLLDHEQELKIFIDKYLKIGNKIEFFMAWICNSWVHFNDFFFESNNVSELVKNTILYLDVDILNDSSKNKCQELLNSRLGELFKSGVNNFDFEKLVLLDVKVEKVLLCEDNLKLVNFLLQKNLYEININNLRFYMKNDTPDEFFGESNYSLISNFYPSIKSYIDSNIDEYLFNVFLELPNNKKEEEKWLIDLLRKTDDLILKKKIIDKQDVTIFNLQDVDSELYEFLLENNKVGVDWISFDVLHDFVHQDHLMTYLVKNHKILSKMKISDEKTRIAEFVYCAHELNDDVYANIVNSISNKFDFFPEGISKTKKEMLINAGCVMLTQDTFESVKNDNNLVASLIVNDFEGYSNEYLLNESVCRLILKSNILDRDQKLNMCYEFLQSGLPHVDIRMAIAEFLSDGDFDDKKFSDSMLQEIIQLSRTTETAIKLIVYLIDFKDKKWITDTIIKLEKPYDKIGDSGGGKVVLPLTETNIKLAQKLEQKGFVSSVQISDKIEIQKFRK